MNNLSTLNNIGNNVNYGSTSNPWQTAQAQNGFSQDQIYKMYQQMMQAQKGNQNDQTMSSLGTIAGKLYSDAKARENDGMYKGAIVGGVGKTDKENYEAFDKLTNSGEILKQLGDSNQITPFMSVVAENPEILRMIGIGG